MMLYRQHRIPLLATYRQQTVRAHLEILERSIARDRVIDDLSQHDVDSYALARRSGTLESPHKPGQEPGVHDGTIRNELTTLMAVLNWGVVFRLGGRLRASDVLLSRDQMVTALAMIGAPIAWAEQWPHGALRFSAKFDKRGYASVIPLSGGIPSAARSRPSVAIFPTSTSCGRGMAFVARHARELPALGRTGYAQCRRTLQIAPEAQRKWHKRGTGGSELIALYDLTSGRLRFARLKRQPLS